MIDTTQSVIVELSEQEATDWSDALADVIQWLNGFQAALPDDTSKRLPTLWHKLSEIKLRVDRQARATTIPF